ncbi:hypothetical protein Poli38472_002393 [Pythium oligandrum]|uniref:Uncharacterized protein n=1 Tax=Pythium oligandrum TaxID=41045 RepID=A0A8K1FL40_PYTOL|nr:hypothetical protein Poli38472_002393 [Pythium oligandrum]|eukprot:TMW63452.1 hypothetical protein Poli38472_002393 [Pythium oligandrum]
MGFMSFLAALKTINVIPTKRPNKRATPIQVGRVQSGADEESLSSFALTELDENRAMKVFLSCLGVGLPFDGPIESKQLLFPQFLEALLRIALVRKERVVCRGRSTMAPAQAKFEIPEVDTNPFKMAAVGNLQLLETLVEPVPNADGKAPVPFNVNAKDVYGCTPLIWAARNGYVEVVEYLVSKGADLEITSFGGMRALHHAANHTRHNAVSRLIELGANVDVKDDAGNTPLHFAASRGILNPIILLLNAGAKVNAPTTQEVTPLMKAVNAGHVTAVEKLIDNDANVNLANSEGNTALHLAARGGFMAIVKVLLEARANTGARNKAGKTPKEIALSGDIAKLLE